MALSHLCGFDLQSTGEFYATGGTTVPTVTTTGARTGACLRINFGTGLTQGYVSLRSRTSGGTFVSFLYSLKFYLKINALPTSANSGTTGPQLLNGFLAGVGKSNLFGVRPDGTCWAYEQSHFSTTALTADGNWHRIEIDAYSTGSDLYIDGSLQATQTVVVPTLCDELRCGAASGLADGDFLVDDLICFDATTSGQLGKDWAVNLLLPASDNAVGNWKRNDGTTTTSLWDSVNNTPPTGTAVTSTLAANYIQNGTAGSGVANDQYDVNCAAYNSVTNLTAASQVFGVQAVCNDAQQVTTGSPKSGAVVIASNPTGQTERTFDFGLPNGTGGSTTAAAQGAFPTGWGTHWGPASENPTVTVSTGPVARVHRTGTYTRVVSVDFLGVYTAWSPLAHSLVLDERRVRRNSLLRR